jgi:hypothetical protein
MHMALYSLQCTVKYIKLHNAMRSFIIAILQWFTTFMSLFQVQELLRVLTRSHS